MRVYEPIERDDKTLLAHVIRASRQTYTMCGLAIPDAWRIDDIIADALLTKKLRTVRTDIAFCQNCTAANSQPELIMLEGGIEALRKLAAARKIDIRLQLNGGYSRKSIRWTGREWRVLNHIDNTTQKLSDDELWTESNIGKWMDAGAIEVEQPE